MFKFEHDDDETWGDWVPEQQQQQQQVKLESESNQSTYQCQDQEEDVEIEVEVEVTSDDDEFAATSYDNDMQQNQNHQWQWQQMKDQVKVEQFYDDDDSKEEMVTTESEPVKIHNRNLWPAKVWRYPVHQPRPKPQPIMMKPKPIMMKQMKPKPIMMKPKPKPIVIAPRRPPHQIPRHHRPLPSKAPQLAAAENEHNENLQQIQQMKVEQEQWQWQWPHPGLSSEQCVAIAGFYLDAADAALNSESEKRKADEDLFELGVEIGRLQESRSQKSEDLKNLHQQLKLCWSRLPTDQLWFEFGLLFFPQSSFDLNWFFFLRSWLKKDSWGLEAWWLDLIRDWIAMRFIIQFACLPVRRLWTLRHWD